MTANNKSEIAESFKNLLEKADEMALEKKKDEILDEMHLNDEIITDSEILINDKNIDTNNRLGIKSIKRMPENPFPFKNKNKNEDYVKNRKELIIKLSVILNKHIHYWLQKELPKFSKVQLKKHITNLLINLQNK